MDVGANAGQFEELLRHRGYAGRIISFEPVKEVFRELENTFRSGACDHRHFVQRSLEQIGRAQVNRRKSGPDTPISLAASQMSPKCFTSVRLAKAGSRSARLAGSLWVDGATALPPEPLTEPPTRSATNSARNRRSSIRPGREVRTRGIALKKFLQAKHARGGPTRRANRIFTPPHPAGMQQCRHNGWPSRSVPEGRIADRGKNSTNLGGETGAASRQRWPRRLQGRS